MRFRVLGVLLAGALLVLAAGCKSHSATFVDEFDISKVDKALPEGAFGLFKLDPKDYPDMRRAWLDKTNLLKAVDKSIQYMNARSSARFFPSGPNDPITHAQVLASLQDFRKMLLDPALTADAFQQQILSRYDVWASKGYNWDTRPANQPGDVWFTGYFTPIYHGSRTPTADYKYPVYGRPSDLVSDPITGDVQGIYPTRRELTASGKLRGLEKMYFRKPIEPFLIQVQGSGKVILPDGQEVLLGYAGSNGRDHRGLGSELVKDGKIDVKHLSLPAVLDYFEQHPGELDDYIMRNDRFVFVSEYGPKEWPSGSLGVQVTDQRTLATDKKIFPRAAVAFVTCNKPTMDGSTQLPYEGFVLDQDTGGAIRAAGRADIYMGIGDQAGKQAGHQFAQGHLYYLFLKPGQYPEGSPAFPDLRTVPPAKSSAALPAGTVTPRKSPPPRDSEIFPGALRN